MADKSESETHKEVSVAEFFEKNRHLLGFNNPAKSLLTSVKEAVDNALDACEQAKVLPEIKVVLEETGKDRFKMIVEDNGPGIIRKHLTKSFGKLLYGSKFQTTGGKQSLTADEPVLIKRDNKAELIPISKLVDDYLAEGEEVKDISDLQIFAPAFDWKNYKYSFRKVSHLIRHKRENEVIKITTESGKSIKVTGCHSLFTVDSDCEVKEIEARKLQVGQFLVAPKSLPISEKVTEINIVDYVSKKDIKKKWFYVYGISKEVILNKIFNSETVHKKTDKSRNYYRIKTIEGQVDVLDDSAKQYLRKGFLPLQLFISLNIKPTHEMHIQTYYHGQPTKIPVIWELTPSLMRFLGLFVAEGHCDKRDIAFTFGLHEDYLVDEISKTARLLGANVSIIRRESSIRVRVFGGILSILFEKWCGRGAHNKKAPEFTFRTTADLRQHFLDGLYLGDGHKTKGRNCLSLSTVSRGLANQVMYLWMMQGVQTGYYSRTGKGLGKKDYLAHVLYVYSNDINKSFTFKTTCPVKTMTRVSRNLALLTKQNSIESDSPFLTSDLCLLKVRDIEIINDGYENVYDLSIPECENFVGGFGGIACHNSRGQQGIGISAVILYGQLTTGKPAVLISKTKKDDRANMYVMHIDVKKNEPEIVEQSKIDWDKPQGVRIAVEMQAKYVEHKQSVLEYIKETAIVNPHAKITYIDPKSQKLEFPRVTENLPKRATAIKPHPHGVELGVLKRLIKATNARTIKSFLTKEFDKVGAGTADAILKEAKLDPRILPRLLTPEQQEALLESMQTTKIMSPTTDCLSPITSELLKKSLESEYDIEFAHSITRSPSVYRGNPFQIEIAVGYGGELDKEGSIKLIRFANKVPLLYQEGACAITQAVKKMNWKPYGLSQSSGSMPTGPAVLVVHMASVWVPFTSEGKEAISNYPAILKEVKLALQECARSLQRYVGRKQRAEIEAKKRETFKAYASEVAESINSLMAPDSYKLSKQEITKKSEQTLKKLLKIAESMYSTGADIEELEEIEEKIEKQEEGAEKEESAEKELKSEREEEKEEFEEDKE